MNDFKDLNANVKIKEVYKKGYVKWVKCECSKHGQFEKKYKPKNLLSYCEKDKFSGKSYFRNGFEFYKESQPSYNYYKKQDMLPLSRLSFQKHKLKEKLEHFDKNLTEWENMSNNGYLRLFDYGNFVFIKEYK